MNRQEIEEQARAFLNSNHYNLILDCSADFHNDIASAMADFALSLLTKDEAKERAANYMKLKKGYKEPEEREDLENGGFTDCEIGKENHSLYIRNNFILCRNCNFKQKSL